MWHTKYIFYKSCSSSEEWFCWGRVHYLSEVLLKKVLSSGFDCADSATPIYINFCYVYLTNYRRLFYGLNWCRTSSFFTAENSRRYIYECIKAFEKRCVSVSRKFKQFFPFLSFHFLYLFSLVRMYFIRNIDMNSIIFRKSILMFYIYFRSKLTYFFFLFKDNFNISIFLMARNVNKSRKYERDVCIWIIINICCLN